jgi:putative DNA primase/helicase
MWHALPSGADPGRCAVNTTQKLILDAVRYGLSAYGQIAGREATQSLLEQYSATKVIAGLVDDGAPERLLEELEARLPGCTVVPGERARIEYSKDEPLRALGAATEALRRHGARIGVMVFGGRLMRPAVRTRPGIPKTDGTPTAVQSLELVPHNETTLAAALNEACQFVRVGKSPVTTDCPEKLARALLGNTHELCALEISSVTHTPILVGDTVRSEPGFHSQRGKWLLCPKVELPANPGKAAAALALERLKTLLREFPFESPLDRAVALAGMLTAALRGSLPFAPGFIVSKPDYGSGASTLCELLHVLLTGRRAPVVNATRDSEELTKQLDGLQLAGRAAALIDNIADGTELRSIALGLMLSQPYRECRPLGRSTMVEVPCSQMVMANGCNVRPSADLARRFVMCELDPGEENPETRTFSRPNLLQDVMTERASILADCFTVVLAYIRSGERVNAAALVGYEEWRRLVQEPLIWLGECDPVESRRKIVAEDPAKTLLLSLFNAWRTLYGSASVTSAELQTAANEWGVASDPPTAEFLAHKELHRVFSEVGCDRAGKINARNIGYWLRGRRNRIVAGLRLVSSGDAHVAWCVVPKKTHTPYGANGAASAAPASTPTPAPTPTPARRADEEN